MNYVNRFQDLGVYQLTKKFPKEERYALTDQIRRSSRSIGGQISEAWGKRRYEKHFVSKLTDADGEQLETQHWLLTALDCEYITKDSVSHAHEKVNQHRPNARHNDPKISNFLQSKSC